MRPCTSGCPVWGLGACQIVVMKCGQVMRMQTAVQILGEFVFHCPVGIYFFCRLLSVAIMRSPRAVVSSPSGFLHTTWPLLRHARAVFSVHTTLPVLYMSELLETKGTFRHSKFRPCALQAGKLPDSALASEQRHKVEVFRQHTRGAD